MYQPDEARLRKFWHTLQEVWLRLYTLKVPLASAINGHAPAAGTLMATCSDYRVMVGSNPKFTMGLNEAKFGLVAPFWYASFFKKCIVLFFYAIYVCTLKKLFHSRHLLLLCRVELYSNWCSKYRDDQKCCESQKFIYER